MRPSGSWKAALEANYLEQFSKCADLLLHMRTTALLTGLFAAVLPGLEAQEIILPEPLAAADVQTVPFLYNGRMTSGGGSASGSLVGNGVIVTAAHVIYDDENFQWIPASFIDYNPRYHQGATTPSGTTEVSPVKWLRWTSYDFRKKNDDSGPGLSSPDTFNIDFAVGYISSIFTQEVFALYPQVHVDPDGGVGILRDSRIKMHVGYPVESPQIPSGDRGLMHSTAPADYFSWWGGLEDIEEVDSENLWIAMYDLEGVSTYGGSSGGPMYVEDDLGNWVMAGIVVGSNGSDGMLVRGIDDNAWEWIEQAIAERGFDGLRRVDNLSVVATTKSRVDLDWSDHSTGEAGYTVYRRDRGKWESIATLGPDATTYTDTANVQAGHVYHYQVQPFAANGNRPPRSAAVAARTEGNNAFATTALAQPWLQFSNRGESNWHLDAGNRLRSGETRSLGHSSLRLDIIGPGTLAFDWSVSCEENPDYTNPQSPNEGKIYDAIHLYLNGEPVLEGEEPVFLSGEKGPVRVQLAVPDGEHIVEWRYIKDPYTQEGEDAGYLDSLQWTPDPVAPYPVFGAYAFEGTLYHGSEWFGVWYAEFWPWAAHLELGWMYFSGTPDGRLYGYSTLPLLGNFYTTPAMFPYLYLLDSGTWMYYYEGTGLWGRKAWFWNANTGDFVQTP